MSFSHCRRTIPSGPAFRTLHVRRLLLVISLLLVATACGQASSTAPANIASHDAIPSALNASPIPASPTASDDGLAPLVAEVEATWSIQFKKPNVSLDEVETVMATHGANGVKVARTTSSDWFSLGPLPASLLAASPSGTSATPTPSSTGFIPFANSVDQKGYPCHLATLTDDAVGSLAAAFQSDPELGPIICSMFTLYAVAGCPDGVPRSGAHPGLEGVQYGFELQSPSGRGDRPLFSQLLTATAIVLDRVKRTRAYCVVVTGTDPDAVQVTVWASDASADSGIMERAVSATPLPNLPYALTLNSKNFVP